MNTQKNKSGNIRQSNIPAVRRCYYDDNYCEGKIIFVGGFKKYLCEKCKNEEDSIPDDCGDIHDFSIGERQ